VNSRSTFGDGTTKLGFTVLHFVFFAPVHKQSPKTGDIRVMLASFCGAYQVDCFDALQMTLMASSEAFVNDNYNKQEGQHPLTGQRAANFRLLAN